MTYEVQIAKFAPDHAGQHGTAHKVGEKDGEAIFCVRFLIPTFGNRTAEQCERYPASDLLFEYEDAMGISA
jgi:hypothetical protein